MKPTPIFVYDKDEILRLILQPKNHTSIVPGKSGYTQIATAFIGDEETSPMRIARPLPYMNGKYIEELNGQETLEFEVPYTEQDEEVEWIEGDGRAVIRDSDGNLVEFIIREVHDEDGDNGTFKRVLCESAEYELNDEWLTGYTAQNVTLRTAMTAILQGTRFEPGIIMDTEPRNVSLGPMSVKRAITELISLYGGEKRKRVEFRGNRITRRYIDILSRRGEFTGKRFEYGKDIQSIKREIDYSQVKTALYGFGESTVNDGPRVDFADVVWSKANGDPVDKPAGQRWVGDPEALARYGYDGGTRHRFGLYESQTGDPGQLLLETWQELQRRSWPIVTYELDVIVLEQLVGWDHEQVRLGDGVYVIDRDMKPITALEAHVIRIEHDLNDPSRSRVLLDNFRDSFFAENERLRSIERIINDRRGNWDYKETPQGAWEKAHWALSEAERQIEEANQELEQAKQRLNQAELNIAQAQQDITEAQTRLDNLDQELSSLDIQKISEGIFALEGGSLYLEGTLYTRSGGVFDGDIVARNLTLAGDIAAQNAVITGTIVGSGATFQQVDIADANIINANIQDATITGTLNGVNGTFTGELIGVTGIFVGRVEGGEFIAESNVTNTRTVINPEHILSEDLLDPNNWCEIVQGHVIIEGQTSRINLNPNGLFYTDLRSGSTGHWSISRFNDKMSLYGWRGIELDTTGDAYPVEVLRPLSVNKIQGLSSGDVITFGSSGRMSLTETDSYPHYGLILGQVMIKGLDSATQQVQIRNRNDTSYRDLVLRDMYCTGNGYFGPSESYMYMRSTTTYGYIHSPAGGDHYIRFASTGQVAIYVDGTARHIFQPGGTKTGGSYEFSDGKVLGMSPIDSPQSPIEYIIFDVEVTEEGTEIELDERFVEIVNGKYAVFVSATDQPVRVEKQTDRFILKGPSQVVDLRVIGIRRDCADQFWVDMSALEEEENEQQH